MVFVMFFHSAKRTGSLRGITRAGIGALTVLLLLFLGACAHLDKPEKIVNSSEFMLDWGKSPPDAFDRARHTLNAKKPFEWWYFDGHLDSGETFVGVFFNPSFTTNKPGVAFSLYDASWEKETFLISLRDEEMFSSTDDVHIECPAGYVHMVDETTYDVMWDMGEIKAEFTLTTEAPGWRPRGDDGVNEDHLDFFWAVHQARNRIEGTLTRGEVTTRVTGIGYFDHNWGKKPLHEITKNWIWGRILAGEYTIIYADVHYIDPSITSRPLYIARGDEVIVGVGSPTVTQWDFVTHPILKRHYPRNILIEYSHGDIEATFAITFKELVEEVDLLGVSSLHPFAQWIARTFFARPTYFRVIADFEGTITESGVKDNLSGECLYEIMGFE
ncbi:MAG TPA: hypothetical protein ENN34_11765 [Deltaproteobacteria bacterium]|nr:hypothetical protein [Deltaproteobacteria bacterium]